MVVFSLLQAPTLGLLGTGRLVGCTLLQAPAMRPLRPPRLGAPPAAAGMRPGLTPLRRLPIVAHDEVATAVHFLRGCRAAADVDVAPLEINILRVADFRVDAAQRFVVGLEAASAVRFDFPTQALQVGAEGPVLLGQIRVGDAEFVYIATEFRVGDAELVYIATELADRFSELLVRAGEGGGKPQTCV